MSPEGCSIGPFNLGSLTLISLPSHTHLHFRLSLLLKLVASPPIQTLPIPESLTHPTGIWYCLLSHHRWLKVLINSYLNYNHSLS